MNDFIGLVVNTCIEHGYTAQFIAEESVKVPNTEIKCSGYLDGKLKLLAVGTKRPADIWLGVLAHEFCHLLQGLDNHPYFTSEVVYDELFDKWLEGQDVDNIEFVIKQVRDVELDCEKRTVELIKQYNLPINLDEYIRMSNAYVLSHNLMLKKRKFITGRVSDLAKDVRIPAEFLDNYDVECYDYILEGLF